MRLNSDSAIYVLAVVMLASIIDGVGYWYWWPPFYSAGLRVWSAASTLPRPTVPVGTIQLTSTSAFKTVSPTLVLFCNRVYWKSELRGTVQYDAGGATITARFPLSSVVFGVLWLGGWTYSGVSAGLESDWQQVFLAVFMCLFALGMWAMLVAQASDVARRAAQEYEALCAGDRRA
jgi:hypothetical protein